MSETTDNIIASFTILKNDIESNIIKYSAEGNGKALQQMFTNLTKIGYEPKIPVNAIDSASANGNCHILLIWQESELEMNYSEDAIDLALEYDNIDSVFWWLQSGLPMKCSQKSIDWITENERHDLDWLHGCVTK